MTETRLLKIESFKFHSHAFNLPRHLLTVTVDGLLCHHSIALFHLGLNSSHPLFNAPFTSDVRFERQPFTFTRVHFDDMWNSLVILREAQSCNVVKHLKRRKNTSMVGDQKLTLLNATEPKVYRELNRLPECMYTRRTTVIIEVRLTLSMCSWTQSTSLEPRTVSNSSSEMKKKRGKAFRFDLRLSVRDF